MEFIGWLIIMLTLMGIADQLNDLKWK